MASPGRTLGAMTVVEDAARVDRAGSWVVAGIHGSSRVSALVPDVFEDYARVFHPAARADGAEVSWREVAAANGKAVHPAMQWKAITGGDEGGGLWDRAPRSDSLPLRLTRVLCEILAAFTGTPDRCWCAVWEGYAHMIGLRADSTLPRLPVWNRPMIVACGPLEAIPERSFTDGFEREQAQDYRSPGLWWPDDRAWCVATDVDMQDTYLGASAACVDRLLADERLEVARVTADQDITWDSDVVNRPD